MSVIAFGASVRDEISGFEGLIACRVKHMHGCVRYFVQPPLGKDGKLPEEATFDGPNLKVIAPNKEGLTSIEETPDTFGPGVKVKDKLIDREGRVVACLKYPYAGDRYAIQFPVDKEGKLPKIETLDENDLEQIDPPPPPKKKEEEKKKPKRPAGPHDHSTTIAR